MQVYIRFMYICTYYLERFDAIIQGDDDIQRIKHSTVWETISPSWTLESRSWWQRFVLQDTDGLLVVRYLRIVCLPNPIAALNDHRFRGLPEAVGFSCIKFDWCIYIYLYGIWYTWIYTMLIYYVCMYIYTYVCMYVIFRNIRRNHPRRWWYPTGHAFYCLGNYITLMDTLESRLGWQRFVLQDTDVVLWMCTIFTYCTLIESNCRLEWSSLPWFAPSRGIFLYQIWLMYIYLYMYGIWYTFIYTMFMYYVYTSSYLIYVCMYILFRNIRRNHPRRWWYPTGHAFYCLGNFITLMDVIKSIGVATICIAGYRCGPMDVRY
jgi:hypothetical protein